MHEQWKRSNARKNQPQSEKDGQYNGTCFHVAHERRPTVIGRLVYSPSRFTLKHYSRRKYVSSAKQFLPQRIFSSAP